MAAFSTNLSSTLPPPHNRRLFSLHTISPSSAICNRASVRFQRPSNVFPNDGLKRRKTEESMFSWSSRGRVVCAIFDANSKGDLSVKDQKVTNVDGVEPFGGKSGSVSFVGLTHQMVEEGKLVSAPFQESRSLLWVVAPIALISSVLIPQFFGILSTDLIQDVVLTEIVYTVSSEVMFYIGLATFLLVTDRVQRPYLQYSAKRWSLITGLRGYLSSACVASVVSVGPYLTGCLVQFIFEKVLEKRQSSCWPLVPILFEVYRLYQLSKAMHFMEKLMFQMRGLPKSPDLMEKSGALAAMIVTFEVLALVCIWSFLTFIQRLFPSRPVAENY
ncbi:hypothetical protein HanIR_Chr16g0800171 [Helianthus annuus]|nr:hypothetical protein HanIR_Chr16g0800171 [Helianthus annuus]